MFREKDRRKCEELYEKYYSGRKWSRTFYAERIRKHATPGGRLLDAGCGRYLEFSSELSDDLQVVGIDLEKQFETHNQRSPFAVRGDLERLPFPDGCFDTVISRSVVEHLAEPEQVFQEFARVLKPGGKVIISTPNKLDYVSLIAMLTPYMFHRVAVSRIVGVAEHDVFPTLYRANTLCSLSRALSRAGLQRQELSPITHYPVYLMFSPVLFRMGVLWERLTSLNVLRFLRGTLLAVFEKPLADPHLKHHSLLMSRHIN
jgi:2-polyprenyl-3-methyl-5-hydroxy-6-metoxy-1,4-benzoquinol methylase